MSESTATASGTQTTHNCLMAHDSMYEDDSSRYITGYGVFENATSHNAVSVFKEACKTYGTPFRNIGPRIHSTQSKPRQNTRGSTEFEMHLQEKGVKHILGRIAHPQTNGKIERIFEDYKYKIQHFKDVAGPPGPTPFASASTKDPTARFVNHHNNERHRVAWEDLQRHSERGCSGQVSPTKTTTKECCNRVGCTP